MTARKSLRSVEAGRGLAALLVVLYHGSAAILPTSRYWHGPVAGRFFDFGFAGVEFFFVLSGFILAHVHWRDIGEPLRLARYARRRLLRIYPAYWAACAATMLLLVVQLRLGARIAPPDITLSSVLLVGPDYSTPVLGVAWTLFHEILFYAVFALWIAAPRLGAVISLAWLGAIVAGGLGFNIAPAYVQSPLNLLFGAGIATWLATRNGHLPAPVACLVAGLALFLGLGVDTVYFGRLAEMPRNLAFGAASAMALAGAVTLEHRRPLGIPAPLLTLGAASYAIYLVHFPLLNTFHKLLGMAGANRWFDATAACLVIVALSVSGGLVFHFIIEQPLRRRLEALLQRASTTADRPV